MLARARPGRCGWRGPGTRSPRAVLTSGTLLSLDRMARVLDVDGPLVRVEAGMSLHRLSRELHLRGLALPNLGDIDVQSVAGALATGTHGTGARLPNLSAQVERIELVLGDGSERRARRAATCCAPPGSGSARSAWWRR